MKDKLLKEISESGSFTENNIFQFCVDNYYDIGTRTCKDKNKYSRKEKHKNKGLI